MTTGKRIGQRHAPKQHAEWVRTALADVPAELRDALEGIEPRELEREIVASSLDAAETLHDELRREAEYQRGSIRGITMHGIARRLEEIVTVLRREFNAGEDMARIYEALDVSKKVVMSTLEREHYGYYAELKRDTGQERLQRALEARQ